VDLSAFTGFVGVTLQAGDGHLLGWAPVGLGGAAADPQPATPDGAAAGTPTPPERSSRPWIGATDGVLLAVGALVLAGASLLASGRGATGTTA